MAHKKKKNLRYVVLLLVGACMAAIGIWAFPRATQNIWLAYVLMVGGLAAVALALLRIAKPDRKTASVEGRKAKPRQTDRQGEPRSTSIVRKADTAVEPRAAEPARRPLQRPEPVKPAEIPAVAEAQDEGGEIVVPEMIDGHKRKYVYQDVRIYTPALTEALAERVAGQVVTLRQEPENTYDPNAVAVWHAESKIGYLYKGKLQDMANDYLRREDPIFAAASRVKIDEDQVNVELCLAFYPTRRATGTTKRFKLSGNTGAERQEQIGFADEGDLVEYSYDFDKEKYEAICNGDSIGFFPKSANELLEDDASVVVAQVEENDQGKWVVYVDVETYEDA